MTTEYQTAHLTGVSCLQNKNKNRDRLKPHRTEEAAHLMYDRLRQEDPSVGDVFDKRLDWAAQERIFTIMIGNLVSRLLEDPSTNGLVDTLVRLGKRHHELGVCPKQYTSMQVGR